MCFLDALSLLSQSKQSNWRGKSIL